MIDQLWLNDQRNTAADPLKYLMRKTLYSTEPLRGDHCIAVTDKEMEEVYSMVRRKTPVYILP